MTENEVIEALTELLEASKNYENTTRLVAAKLKSNSNLELLSMKERNPKIKRLINEYEEVYTRINNEI
ncbi:hypothetical protein OK18_19245 [Chryseobacterium gallinarum]|uniref:Uncharacterized protein n=1 Tax=Chryseobacterium gallinarum TaxID=1324352 RepID=A0A0G3MBI0_CHRGL|nr:hypothetical protein [Chryseobacterium gallinarum]AKK74467.1 hypothetical protein OK18_19245 [Chryseobacterium gallinarum]